MTGHGSKKVARVHGDVDHTILTKNEADRRAAADADSDEMKQAIADGFSIFSWSASSARHSYSNSYNEITHGPDISRGGYIWRDV